MRFFIPLATRCVVLVLILGLTLPGSAREPFATPSLPATGSQEPDSKTSSRTARRLLRLDSGRVLRGKTRRTEWDWELEVRGRWTRIPAARVTRATLERDALARSRKLDRSSRGDPIRRTAYGDWLLEVGLYSEGLKVLDALLRTSPDHEQACAVLARHDPPIALPRTEELDGSHLEGLLELCAKAGPAAQEVAAQRLRKANEISGLEETLLSELHSGNMKRRQFATRALRRALPGRHVRPLLSRAVLDVNDEVRLGAALALKEADDPAVAVPAIRALGSKHSTVRKNAAEALGVMNYGTAVAPLMNHLTTTLKAQSSANRGAPRSHVFVGRQRAYIQDFDVEVAQNSSIADPVINVLTEGSVLDAASVGVHETSIATERAAVRSSLGQLTGATPGKTTASWERWWKEHGDEWKAALPPGPPSTPARREN